jgi:hypothetical protein
MALDVHNDVFSPLSSIFSQTIPVYEDRNFFYEIFLEAL